MGVSSILSALRDRGWTMQSIERLSGSNFTITLGGRRNTGVWRRCNIWHDGEPLNTGTGFRLKKR